MSSAQHEELARAAGRPPDRTRLYVGERGAAGCRVFSVADDGVEPLSSRERHSLWSFSWGRPGVLSRELAWALLFDTTHDHKVADDWCASFSAEVVTHLPRESFVLPTGDVLGWLETVPEPEGGAAQ